MGICDDFFMHMKPKKNKLKKVTKAQDVFKNVKIG